MQTIKDLLISGKTPKELIDDLNSKIIEAQREIDAEKNRESELSEARTKLTDAMAEYFSVLGFEKDNTWQDYFESQLKTIESIAKKYKPENVNVKIKGDITPDKAANILSKWFDTL